MCVLVRRIAEDCNAGKNYFKSVDAGWMRKVMARKSVHVRLGETLKAFKGEAVPAATLEFVAQPGRLEKARPRTALLGWEIETFNRKLSEGGRGSSYYQLVNSRPWPGGPRTGIIRQYERRGRRAEQGRRLRLRRRSRFDLLKYGAVSHIIINTVSLIQHVVRKLLNDRSRSEARTLTCGFLSLALGALAICAGTMPLRAQVTAAISGKVRRVRRRRVRRDGNREEPRDGGHQSRDHR